MNPPEFHRIPDIPRLHNVPLAEIQQKQASVTLLLDDAEEQKMSLRFSPFQAMRVTTEDCFDWVPRASIPAGGVYQVVSSPWIAELSASLSKVDRTATFLEKSIHFLLPAGDKIIEIVAWSVKWEGGNGSGEFPDLVPGS